MKKRLPEYLNKIRAKNLSNGGHYIYCSCPLHRDNNPSISATRAPDGIWLFMCHSCNAKGSIIDLHAAQERLDAHADFWPIIERLEKLLGPGSPENLDNEDDNAEAFALEWLRENFVPMKQLFKTYLENDRSARITLGQSLQLPDNLLCGAARLGFIGIIPTGTDLYTNRGKFITINEPRLVFMGQSHFKIRRPYGDLRESRFMFVGHPSEPWCGEALRDQRCSPEVVHCHESETSALALMASGFWPDDFSSVVVSGHGANGFKPEWAHLFKGREVHFWPDADEGGRKFVAKVSAALSGVARKMVMHDWKTHLKAQGVPWHDECKDVRDAFIKGGAEALLNVPGTKLDPALWTKSGKDEGANPLAVGKKMCLVHCSQIQLETEPDQLVDGLLTEGCSSVVYGDSNVGKTFFVLDLAAAVASGQRVAGRKVLQSPVVYVSMEGARRFNCRVVAMKEAGRLSNEAPFYLASWPLALLEHDKVDEFVKAVLDQMPAGTKPGLIVLDTLSRGMAGGDETSSVDMTTAIAAVDRIRHETGAHCLLIHHSGKDRSKGGRGHSSLRAAIDSEFEVLRDGEGVPFVHNTKQRDLSKAADFRFRLRQHHLGFNGDGEDITTCTVEYISGTPVEAKTRGAKKGTAMPPSIDDVCACLKNEAEPRDIVVKRIVEKLGTSQRMAKTLVEQALADNRIREEQVKVQSGQKRLHLCLVGAPAHVP